jgi:general stress protein YciG
MNTPRKRGFAAMDPTRQRQIAALGGKSAHARGTAHQFTREEAREAGRKGGQAPRRKPDAPEAQANQPPVSSPVEAETNQR